MPTSRLRTDRGRSFPVRKWVPERPPSPALRQRARPKKRARPPPRLLTQSCSADRRSQCFRAARFRPPEARHGSARAPASPPRSNSADENIGARKRAPQAFPGLAVDAAWRCLAPLGRHSGSFPDARNIGTSHAVTRAPRKPRINSHHLYWWPRTPAPAQMAQIK